MTDSDTIKKCWYWPDTDTDTRIGAALYVMEYVGQYVQLLSSCPLHEQPKSEFILLASHNHMCA